jgi:hypothetical protein
MSFWDLTLLVVLLTLLFEGGTCLLRFGFGMKAPNKLSWMKRWTRGYRIHHGYPGVALAGVTAVGIPDHPIVWGVVVVGWALLLSDAVHHFVVLPLAVGRTEFYLRFPTDQVLAEDSSPVPATTMAD